MATPAHTDFDSANPQASQSPSAYATSDLNDLRALRDMIIAGFVPGFVQSRTNGTGTANQPQIITWYNAGLTIGFRWNITWTGFNPTTVAEEWTNDGGATWANVGTYVLTFDGSQNITASTNAGGWVVMFMEVWAKILNAVSGLAAHIATTGTAVHGLGTMSTQNANAIAVTGGTTDNLTEGGTTPGKLDAQRVREVIANSGNAIAVAAGATFNADLSAASYHKIQPSATQTDTFTIGAPSNPPSGSRTHTWILEIVNGKRSADGKITWDASFHWLTGAASRPHDDTLELAGSNIFAATWNGASHDISHLGKRG